MLCVKKISHLFILIVLLLQGRLYAQYNTEIDSLKQALLEAKEDTTRCKILGALTEIINEEELPQYNSQLRRICESQLAKLSKSHPLYLFYKKRLAAVYSNLGLIYQNKGNSKVALEYYHQSLKMQEEINDRDVISSLFFNIAVVYHTQNLYDKELEYYEKSFKKSSEICNTCPEKQDRLGMAYALGGIGDVYSQKGDTIKSIQYLKDGLKVMEETGEKRGEIYISSMLSKLYTRKKEYTKALEYLYKCNEINKEMNNQHGLCSIYSEISAVLYLQTNYKEAKDYGLKGLEIAKSLNFSVIISSCCQTLCKIYQRTNNWKAAFEMYALYNQTNDSLKSQSNRKASIEKDLQYQYEKQAVADSLKIANERQLFEVKMQQEKTQRFALYVGLALVIVFSIFMYNRFRVTNNQKQIIELKEQETQTQKKIIEEKHKEITDSINYAERIQRSFLATKELLDDNLNEYFVFFKPKGVVSGDFYWAANLEAERSRSPKFILATADSTGHGVPGAIMSLLNITSLEKSIETETAPHLILNKTRTIIIDRLKKDGSAEGGKDGMDCSLLVFNKENNMLQIAAANNPVWIVRASTSLSPHNEVIEIKPDKMPVGKHDKQDIPFTLHEIQLQKGDVIYTLTDGFPDQFGGERGKKFMSKKLRELLATNAHLPMHEQKQLLETTFANWKKDVEQVDDVTVIGVRVS